jgi:hypothetical protein
LIDSETVVDFLSLSGFTKLYFGSQTFFLIERWFKSLVWGVWQCRKKEKASFGRVLSDEEKLWKVAVINDLERTTLLEEVSWRQKFRELGLKEGDKCTKFFHRVANSK